MVRLFCCKIAGDDSDGDYDVAKKIDEYDWMNEWLNEWINERMNKRMNE